MNHYCAPLCGVMEITDQEKSNDRLQNVSTIKNDIGIVLCQKTYMAFNLFFLCNSVTWYSDNPFVQRATTTDMFCQILYWQD